LQNLLENLIEENAIEHVTFKQWMSTDRSTPEITVKPSDEFSDMLTAKLAVLQQHSFVAVQQAMYLKKLKSDLQVNTVIVLCDFAENYSFIKQDEAQGFHLNSAHVTFHPFASYFQESPMHELSHTSLIIIYDSLALDTNAVPLSEICN
jgi:hypothetical protein